MLPSLIVLRNLAAFIPLLLLALAVLADASPHGPGAHLTNTRGRQLDPRAAVVREEGFEVASVKPHTTDTGHENQGDPLEGFYYDYHVGDHRTPVLAWLETKATATASTTTTSSPFSSTDTTKSSSPGNPGAAGDFRARKPAHWPAATQSGPKPTSTVASARDPYLKELSKAIGNSGNTFFTESH
ncbi:hypothetical protein B0H14DRAFT_3648216 [Mycena olivaceomarginata]|nr:hypothetical protein B0H14DRAFT_3648216 [Mycena olivaceomarginata]